MDKKEKERLAIIYKEIANLLENGQRVNKYDYYMMGGLSLGKALYTIYTLFREKIINVQEFVTLRNYVGFLQKNASVMHDKEFVLKTYYQFGNRVISNEEKNMIWDELCEKVSEDDIDDLVFSGAVRAYAIKNGLLTIKKEDSKKILKTR